MVGLQKLYFGNDVISSAVENLGTLGGLDCAQPDN